MAATKGRGFRSAALTNSIPPGGKPSLPRAPGVHRKPGAHHIIEKRIPLAPNRFKLAPLGLADEVQRLNSRGVKIRPRKRAESAAPAKVLIAGSIGPLGLGVQSRHPEPEEIQDIFYSRAGACTRRAWAWISTSWKRFSYIEELLIAIDAIRSFLRNCRFVAQLNLFRKKGPPYGDCPFLRMLAAQ